MTTFIISQGDIDKILAELQGIERVAKRAVDPDTMVVIKDRGDVIYQVLNRLQRPPEA